VVAGVVGVPSTQAEVDGFETVSHHTDRDREFAAVATDVAITKPQAVRLKIRNVPDVETNVRYVYGCRGEGRHPSVHDRLTTRSTVIEMPELLDKPKGCLLYATNTFDRDSKRPVKVSIRVLAIAKDFDS
jgi:hypothetical protein